MNEEIVQKKLTDPVKKKIYEGFARHAIKTLGVNGISEDPISFEIFHDEEFMGAIVVQPFWDQLHIKYLFVEEKYRGQKIGSKLLQRALDFADERGYDFVFVETMNFQALEFYQKHGFELEFTRTGYGLNTSFNYLKKDLTRQTKRTTTRFGVYGVAIENEKILLIKQQSGAYKDKFDFPGGRIEFGETPEECLLREFAEEVNMSFDTASIITNLSTTQEYSDRTSYHLAMIYKVGNLHTIEGAQAPEFPHHWIDLKTLTEQQCSPLLWKFLDTL